MSPWHAHMISAADHLTDAPLFRREFVLDPGHGDVVSAMLRATALGVVEAWVNGLPASEDVLTPGWTSYEWRLRYAEWDVTALIEPTTVIGLAVGNGWYRGKLGWTGGSRYYGHELGAFAELRIRFADGHVQTVGTDESWSAGPSATTADDLYDGQEIDARRRSDAWLRPGFSGPAWGAVHRTDFDHSVLEPYIGPPVRRQQSVAPVEVWESARGSVMVDFGQNLVGWVRVDVHGEAGDVVTLRHAEVLEDGELGTRPLRTARATDRYVLSGGPDVFEPTFTFHGFRFVEVDGWPGGAASLRDRGGLEAIVVSSELRRIGRFGCSDPVLERLHENAVWGMRGNFLDVPTDCPQRDERMGWTGDIAVFAPSAVYLADAGDFLRDWLRDLALEQAGHDGRVPFVVPDVIKYLNHGSSLLKDETTAIWSDAAVWVPWAVWTAYADLAVLEEQWPSIASHIRTVRDLLSPNGLWDTGFQFGDWLDPDAPPTAPWQAKADPAVVATACAFRTATLAARIAEVLGRDVEAAEFAAMAGSLRAAFSEHYVDGDRIRSDCPTVYALAIAFDLLDDEQRDAAGRRLAELVREGGYRISTGFAGTPYVLDALTRTGHLADAYRLLMQRECPSWLYPVTMGATTIWERWDSMLPDGRINPGEMTSFNHYALGAVVDWMHRTIGGLAPLEPGYRRALVAPQPGGGLSWAQTSLDTPSGTIAVGWRIEAGQLAVDVDVPDSVEAVLRLPGRDDEVLASGRHRRSVPASAATAG
ncbi:alpha-L-rhamnosidase [Agromyces kandeliae]|uniref:alpha-L-rhamnosidase n=1 Tax=Agromyces kandeliae TaxID=2666141 RepID=A0A6L5R334_9MICO|nr:alpha-L-rhamnosidase [Agromyces kandeliae]MRX44400.1 Bacterial alpha-L-rhamnosidase [Agromyces kandeliae]